MKQAVIFDFGGVLMKTLDYSFRHSWDDRLGLPGNSVERVVHGSESWQQVQRGLMTLEDYWQDVASQLRISQEQLQQLQIDYFRGDYLDADLIDLVKQLRQKGHPVALLSNDSPALLSKLESLGIEALFDPLVISANIKCMKPEPEAYQAVIQKLGMLPEQTVFIDDMPANIAGAKAVGMHTIHYVPDLNLGEVLESLLVSE